jgi:glutamate carboxypeptidase
MNRPLDDRSRSAILVSLFLIVFSAPVGAQSLAPTELKLAAYVDAHAKDASDFLTRLVNINSGTMNPAGVHQVGIAVQAELDRLGFTTRWEDGASFHRAGHLVAERRGPGPRLLLIGHLDTVFEPDSPFQQLEWLDSARARGPGVIDMKGGDVIIVQALKALAWVRALEGSSITVVMTGDEEEPGAPLAEARRTLIDAAQGIDVVLGFENAHGDVHTVAANRRGAVSWTLTVTGTPAHSSQIFKPEVGDGAIYEAARILDGFRTRLAGEQYLTFNPGVMLGGTAVEFDPGETRGTAFGKTNVIAERAVVRGDLRTISPEQLTKAGAAMQAVVAASLPHTSAHLTFDEGYPPMAPSAGNSRLLAAYDQASRDLGLGQVTASDPSLAGAADISFVASFVPMALDGLGLKGQGDHTTGETADMTTLPIQTKRAALLIYRLCRKPGT